MGIKMAGERSLFYDFIDWIVKIIYSKEKRHLRTLFILVLVGAIIRVMAASNLGISADDAIYASQSAGIIKSGILSTHSHPPLFSYLTDLTYNFFGYSFLASRLISLFAGSLTIFLVFLIGKRLFNAMVGLCSAFFAAFSSFLIKMTYNEHSLLIFFFAFFAIYMGLIYL